MPTTHDQWYRLMKERLGEIVDLLDRTHVIVGRPPRITIDNSQVVGTLSSILSQLESIEPSVDGLEALISSTNALITTGNASLVAIDANTDGVETSLAAIDANTDGIEALISSTNALLTTIDVDTSLIDGRLELVDGDSVNDWLKLIKTNTDASGGNSTTDWLGLIDTLLNTISTVHLANIRTNTDPDGAKTIAEWLNALDAKLSTIDTVLDTIDTVLDNTLTHHEQYYPMGDLTSVNMMYKTVTMSNGDVTKDISAGIDALMEMESIDIKSTDTAARTMDIRHYDGANSVNLMRISLAAGADLKFEDLTTDQQSILKHLRIDSDIRMRCIASGVTAGKTIKVETMWTRIRGLTS